MSKLYEQIYNILENTSIPIGETKLKLRSILTNTQLHDITSNITRKLPIDNKIAVEKGICPFPDSCNERKECTKDYCSADTCSNGHAFRWS